MAPGSFLKLVNNNLVKKSRLYYCASAMANDMLGQGYGMLRNYMSVN